MTVLLYFLNVACATGRSALEKQSAKTNTGATVFNLNKTLSGLAVFLVWGLVQGFSLHGPTLALGLCYGVFLCISMHTGFRALALGPMALTSIIASFSLLVPFFFGIFFWKEPLTLFGGCGILLLLLSIVLINGKKTKGFSLRWFLYALATLLTNGACSVIQKYHQMQFPTLYRNEFMVAALLTVSLLLFATQLVKPSQQPQFFSLCGLGLLSGILNGAANYIVLYLSATENASVLFPIVSVANIVAVWLVGLLFFKEKLTLLQSIGLILGIFSVFLLKM